MDGGVVLIDADEATRAWACGHLRATPCASAEAFFRGRSPPGPACLVVDARVPDMTCRQLQAECLRRGLRCPLVFLVDAQQVELAVALVKGGAADVLARPLDADDLRRRVHAVVAAAALAQGQAHAAHERLARLTQRELEVVLLAAMTGEPMRRRHARLLVVDDEPRPPWRRSSSPRRQRRA